MFYYKSLFCVCMCWDIIYEYVSKFDYIDQLQKLRSTSRGLKPTCFRRYNVKLLGHHGSTHTYKLSIAWSL